MTSSREQFKEVQRFRQWFVILPLVAIAAWLTYAVIRQVLFDRPIGTDSTPDWALIIIWLIFGVGLTAMFLGARLITVVDGDGVHIRFFPFHLNGVFLPASEIEEAIARKYRPIVEYGGWGIRYGFGGKAYNVSGNEGVEIRLKDRRRTILVGSRRAAELEAAIRAVVQPR